jgi:HEAT repeat protein
MRPQPLTLTPRDPAARRLLGIAQNLRDLAARDDGVCRAAQSRLADLGPAPAELIHLLGDSDPFVRSAAARQLRHVQGQALPRVVDALRGAIDDVNDHIVAAALGSLGVLRAEAARADVRACLEDANPHVVHAAAFALGLIGPADEGQHLVRLLTSEHRHLQVSALRALTQLRYAPAVPAILARLEACFGVVRRGRGDFEMPQRLVAALVALRAQDAVPLLVRMAREEVGVRGLAVQALIDLHAESAAPALLPLLGQLAEASHEDRLCNSLLALMVAVDYSFAAPEVRRLLAHGHPGVRGAALEALGRWQNVESAPAVRRLCHDDPSAFVRPAAVACLAELLGPAALSDLAALAGDANTLVRTAVVEALARMDPLPPQGTALLHRLADDPAVGRTARAALAARQAEPEPAPTLLSADRAARVLPADLWPQAPAARAFLRLWQSHLRAHAPGRASDEAGEVHRALGKLLDLLGDAPAAAAA